MVGGIIGGMVMAGRTGDSRSGIKGNGWKIRFAYLCFVKLFRFVIELLHTMCMV